MWQETYIYPVQTDFFMEVTVRNYALKKETSYKNTTQRCNINSVEVFNNPTVADEVKNWFAGYTYVGKMKADWDLSVPK